MNQGVRIIFVCIMLLITPSLVLASKTHRVKKNESLYTLAKKHHVSVSELKAANNLVSTHIKNGDVLVIPPSSTASRPLRICGSGCEASIHARLLQAGKS